MLTVTDPADSQNLTTLAAVKAELQLTATDDDALITAMIKQASDLIRAHCGRVFALEGLQESFSTGLCESVIVLTRRPVVTVDSVTVDGNAVDAALYQVDKEVGIATRFGGWQGRNIVVTYHAGFVLPDDDDANLPGDIERAAIQLVKLAYLGRDRDAMIRSEEVNGVRSTTYQTGGFGPGFCLPPDIEATLDLHSDVNV